MKLERFHALCVLAFVGQVAMLGAVACSASSRQSTLHATVVTMDVACQDVRAYAHAHSQVIVSHATSLEDGRAKLAEFRAKVDKAIASCDVAYRAVALGSSLSDSAVADAAKAAADLKTDGGAP